MVPKFEIAGDRDVGAALGVWGWEACEPRGVRQRLTGEGGVSTYLASPRGVINIGPPTLHTIYNCEFNHVDGIDVGGPGLKARDAQGTVLDDRWNTSTGSIGICLAWLRR